MPGRPEYVSIKVACRSQSAIVSVLRALEKSFNVRRTSQIKEDGDGLLRCYVDVLIDDEAPA